MDRKNNRSIITYLAIWTGTAIVLFVAVFCISWQIEQTNRNLAAKFLAMHPQMEADAVEIFIKEPEQESGITENHAIDLLQEKYGYDFYYDVFHNPVWYLWGVFLILMIFLLYRDMWINRREEQKKTDQLNEIIEQLEKFKREEFTLTQAGRERINQADAFGNADTAWRNMLYSAWERLRETGDFFGDLKERVKQEENHTKALVTDLSHQLKTPISSLHISYELIAAEHLSESERAEFVQSAGQEVERLEVLLKELLRLSHLECGMIEVRPETADLLHTLTEAVSQVYMKAHEKSIEVKLETDPQFLEQRPMVRHDPKWTKESLVNVLENAVKYSDEHTTIEIQMTKLPKNMLIVIKDQGIGIKTGELHKIYQRFYRGERARVLAREGSGVGLYLTRSILERQGGTITAKKRRNKGTKFLITLPL